MAICRTCSKTFNKHWHYVEYGDDYDEPYITNQCQDCFENSLEEWDERRRVKLAERNEH